MRNQRTLYEFGSFRVDSGQFLLVRQGQPQPMTPTVFRILLLLLERAGSVVTKEEMISTIWSDSFVEEGNLNRNISTLRKALGETPRDHRYIETIPKTGYRFVAPVRQTEYLPTASTPVIPAPLVHRSFVGRQLERQILRDAFDAAKAGHGGIVSVSGEIGMGKSTLVDTFLTDLTSGGTSFHQTTARCTESRTEPEPFGPFLECLSAMMGADEVAGLIPVHAPTWHRDMTQVTDDNPCAPLSIGRMKREMYELLLQLSALHPLVLVIDDFHWADLASVDLLAFLAVRLPSMRVLVVVNVTPAEMAKKHPFQQTRDQLLGSGMMQHIELRPLTKDNIQEHLESELPDGASLEGLAGTVLARTEGNPLFMVEVIRSVKQDAGFAKRQDAVPDPLRNLIRSQLAPLDESDRALLAAASVQGQEFDSAILARSLGANPEDIEARLQAIAELHGLIYRLREEELMDGNFTVRYSFAHVLCRVVCHEALPPTRKAYLNSAVAQAFLTFYGN